MSDPRVEPVGAERSVWVPMKREETLTEGQEKPMRAPINLDLCPGVGKEGVQKNGVLVCPSCGDPIEEGCGSSRFKRGVMPSQTDP